MGYIRHDAIVVTSWKSEAIEAAAKEATELGCTVIGPSDGVMNGYRTLLVCPDGSNEGWDNSEAGDERRERFRAYLTAQRYDDGSSPLEWVELSYGSDDAKAEITFTEWRPHDEQD
jgi:hypothetical protein